MTMLRSVMAVGMIIFGMVAALLGGVVLFSALRTGGITVKHGAVTQVLTYAAEPTRFLQFAGLLGLAPLLVGLIMTRWGFHTIRRR